MYNQAKEMYAKFGVDTEKALEKVKNIPVSLHCWQGDDVVGFESNSALSGGIQTTGNYPGKARNPQEVMADLDVVYSLIPGKKRLNLHAIYAITDGYVERDQLTKEHFQPWLDWAKQRNILLDFNPTLFSHPMVKNNLTLSSPCDEVRAYWIRHCKATRAIAAYIGEQQGSPCLHNIWIPDGFKNIPVDRLGPRQRLRDSLDEIYSVKYDDKYIVDCVESKVFGIGLESCTVGSNEFYLSYAATRGINALLDNGHFHPTENVADKIPSLLAFFDKVALHVTRPVRWDSDHVVLFTDDIKEIAHEIVACHAEDKVLIGLDYFDASINRIGAWVLGARNVQKALLYACLEPQNLVKLQNDDNFSELMAVTEELKSLPFGDVWNEYLRRENVKGCDWFDTVKDYEKNVLVNRG